MTRPAATDFVHPINPNATRRRHGRQLAAGVAGLVLIGLMCGCQPPEGIDRGTAVVSDDADETDAGDASDATGATDTVTPYGYAGVDVGSTVAEASRASGLDLAAAFPPMDDELGCHYVSPGGEQGDVYYMVIEGEIVRVDIDDRALRTAEGVGVGSTEDDVRDAYPGRVTTTPHPYTGPEGHYLTVEFGDGHALIFETDGNAVVRFRGGKDPAVRWIEGCS